MISNSTPSKFLDPTLDVVFKLLLIGNAELLRDMIEAVLDLQAPIQELEILNPEISEDVPGDKSVVLDVRARLSNGHLIDLEMQSSAPEGTRARFLYYWAKNFVDYPPSCLQSSAWRVPIGKLNSTGGHATCGPRP